MNRFLATTCLVASFLVPTQAARSQCLVQTVPTPEPSKVPQQFGDSVAVDGDRMVVAAMSFESTGRLFVYERGANGWQLTTGLTANPPGELLGITIALEGNRIAATRKDHSIVIFECDPATQIWSQSYVIQDHSEDDSFGTALDFVDGKLIIGSLYGSDPTHYGAVYVYAKTALGWTEIQNVVPNDAPNPEKNFGVRLEARGNLLLVASNESIGFQAPGAVYVFELGPNGYVQTQKLASPNWEINGQFGADMSIGPSRVLISAPEELGQNGRVYVYGITPNGLLLEATLTGSPDPNAVWFGDEVQFADDRVFAFEYGFNGYVPNISVFELIGGAWKCTDHLHDIGAQHFSYARYIEGAGNELIVTVPLETQQVDGYEGKFVVYRFGDRPFGEGCAGSFGVVPRLDLGGCAIGGEKMGFEIEDAFGGGIAFAALGMQKGSVPLGAGCSLLIWPILPSLVGPFPLDGAGIGGGSCNLGFVVPPGVPSGTYLLQALCSDPTSALGFTTTNGIELTAP